jgi:hypothetical protein
LPRGFSAENRIFGKIDVNVAATIVDDRSYPITDSHLSTAHASLLPRHGGVKTRDEIAESGDPTRPSGILLQDNLKNDTDGFNSESKT